MSGKQYVKDIEMRSTLIKIYQFGFFRCDSKPLFWRETFSRGSTMLPRFLSTQVGSSQPLQLGTALIPASVPAFPEVLPSLRHVATLNRCPHWTHYPQWLHWGNKGPQIESSRQKSGILGKERKDAGSDGYCRNIEGTGAPKDFCPWKAMIKENNLRRIK